MKKLSILLAGMVISGAAFAQVATGTVPLLGSGSVGTNVCGLLNEDVRINLTTGVNAGVDCSATRVAISACHTAGRTVSRTQNVPSPVGCGVDADNDGNIDVECNGTEPQTVSGPAMAGASTVNGTVTSLYPGGLCDAAAAVANAATR